ncbi:MAG: hypothetical protein K6F54_13415 [Lachnospiraceae bacterium]|nr:hypothetical protein [Lachnospiraceae bacterium]
MSKELERIEYMANTDVIRNVKEIHDIMRQFLNLRYLDLIRSKADVDFLVPDISRGFVLEEQKVRECSIKDILTIIGYMPGTPWYEIDENEKWFANSRLGKSFYCASSCFHLTDVLNYSERFNIVVKQFMHIGLAALMWYLDVMRDSDDKSVLYYIPENHNVSISMRRTEVSVVQYLRDYRGNEPEVKTNDITLGYIMRLLHKRGYSAWQCGYEPLDHYVTKMKTTYHITQKLFMDCIRKSLISADRQYFLGLMDRCCESGSYEFGDEFDFDCCYE